jgi:hypothetical protein
MCSVRTDQSGVCLPCKRRFTRLAGRCPRCGGEMRDLRDAATRAEVEAAVAPRELPAPFRRAHRGFNAACGWAWGIAESIGDGKKKSMSPWWTAPGFLLLIAVIWTSCNEPSSKQPGVIGWMVLSVMLVMVGTITAMMLAFGLFMLLALFVALPGTIALGLLRLLEAGARAWLHRRHVKRYPRLTLTAPSPGRAPEDSGERVRGVVRVKEPVRSPLWGVPCAAWRLRGEVHWGEVDDGGGTSFEVDTQEGPVTVTLGEATIDLPVYPSTKKGIPAVSWWPRLVVPARLHEAILRDGDEVEVSGACEVSSRSDGYRSSTVARHFHERPHAGTVRIRKL